MSLIATVFFVVGMMTEQSEVEAGGEHANGRGVRADISNMFGGNCEEATLLPSVADVDEFEDSGSVAELEERMSLVSSSADVVDGEGREPRTRVEVKEDGALSFVG